MLHIRPLLLLIVVVQIVSGLDTNSSPAAEDDLRWIRGANYVASYAATDVEMWLHYDHDTIDRELGYAARLDLNCIRVFLQLLVYHAEPDTFLKHFEDFLATADSHGLKVMPILFDSCFGVSPSLESRHMWVANPGPDRMAEKWWPESDAYATAVVSAHLKDPRIVMWDVMNEPTATQLAVMEGGKELIDALVVHNCELVRHLDTTHPITVGVAKWDNSDVWQHVDVLSCHSYAVGAEAFRNDVARTRDQARAAEKPWIVSECCNVAAGSTYEMALPVLREFGVGYFIWQVVIGRDMFNSAAGLVYPDGEVRRIAEIETVLNRPANSFVEKPDGEGIPHGDSLSMRLLEYLEATVQDGVTDRTWRERHTQVESLLFRPHIFGDERLNVYAQLQDARKDYDAGRKDKAFQTVASMLDRAYKSMKESAPTVVPAKRPLATIYRDVYGIPHIFADSEAAGAYAIALAQCEDMGMQVFESLRVGIARRAAFHGEKLVAADSNLLRWKIPETSEQAWQQSSSRTRRFIQAFCNGLNQYRQDNPDECKNAMRVTPVQVVALLRITDIEPSIGILEANVNFALNHPAPDVDFPNQSSTWVIGPSRTASRSPILFIDPHWPAQGRTSWWELHLHTGRFQVGGFAMPGLPFVGLGYTNAVAWGATAGGADSADVFELKINPENPNQYWYDGQWKEMSIRRAKLPVKMASGEVEDRQLVFRETIHGPVIREEQGRVFAGAICGVYDTTKLEQWLEMNRAADSSQLLRALSMDQAAWLNVTYAGSDGQFGYIQTGMCPVRSPEGYQRIGAHDGTRSSANWQGRVKFQELPQIHNPKSGWLQSCNTSADYTTTGECVDIADFGPGVLYAHHAMPGEPIWRGRGLRCFQVMPKMKEVTIDEAENFALDTFAPAGPIWVPPMIAAYDRFGSTFEDKDLSLKMMTDSLRKWNFHVNKESVGATIFRYWRLEYGKLHPNALGENTARGFPKTEEQQRDAVAALAAAATYLKKTFDSSLVPWGQILRLRRGDLDLPLDGDTAFAKGTECLRATGTSAMDDQGHYVFNGGQVIPTVVELTNPIQVRSIVPFGQSRRKESRHYSDQAHLFSEGTMRPAWHSWNQLRDHVQTKKQLEYK